MKAFTTSLLLLLILISSTAVNAQLSLYDPATTVIMKMEYSYGALSGKTNMFNGITDAVDLKYKAQPHKAMVAYTIIDEDIYIPYFDFWFGAYFRNNQQKLKFTNGNKLEEESEFYEYKPTWGTVFMEWNIMWYFLHLETGKFVWTPGIGFYSSLPTFDFEVPLENFNDVEGNSYIFTDEDAYNFSIFPDLYGYSLAFYLAMNDMFAVEAIYCRSGWGPFLGQTMAIGTSYVTSGSISANNIGDIINPLATKFMIEAKFTRTYPVIISFQMEKNTFKFDGVNENAQIIRASSESQV